MQPSPPFTDGVYLAACRISSCCIWQAELSIDARKLLSAAFSHVNHTIPPRHCAWILLLYNCSAVTYRLDYPFPCQMLLAAQYNILHCVKTADCCLLQLSAFQKDFNGLDIDLRSSPEARAELLLRCNELQDALWEICDQRMNDNEAQLRTLK